MLPEAAADAEMPVIRADVDSNSGLFRLSAQAENAEAVFTLAYPLSAMRAPSSPWQWLPTVLDECASHMSTQTAGFSHGIHTPDFTLFFQRTGEVFSFGEHGRDGGSRTATLHLRTPWARSAIGNHMAQAAKALRAAGIGRSPQHRDTAPQSSSAEF